MVSQILAAVAALTFALVSAAPAPQAPSAALPACSGKKVPCSCPAGSTFGNSTTYAVVGSSASDIFAITGDFYETNWFALPTTGKNGPDNTVGSVRELTVGSGASAYKLYEKLTVNDRKSDGSFTQAFEQVKLPTKVPGSTDEYDGYWVTFTVQQIFSTETVIAWNVYRCIKGNPFQFSKFHEDTIKSFTSTLQSQGKNKGLNIGPVSDAP